MSNLMDGVNIADIVSIVVAIAIPIIGYLVDQHSKAGIDTKALFKSRKAEREVMICRIHYYICVAAVLICIEYYWFFIGDAIEISVIVIIASFLLIIMMILCAIGIFYFYIELLNWAMNKKTYRLHGRLINKLFGNSDGIIESKKILIFYMICVPVVAVIAVLKIPALREEAVYWAETVMDKKIALVLYILNFISLTWAACFFTIMKDIRDNSIYVADKINIWTKSYGLKYENISSVIETKDSIAFDYGVKEKKRIVVPRNELVRIEYILDENQLLGKVKARKWEERKAKIKKIALELKNKS